LVENRERQVGAVSLEKAFGHGFHHHPASLGAAMGEAAQSQVAVVPRTGAISQSIVGAGQQVLDSSERFTIPIPTESLSRHSEPCSGARQLAAHSFGEAQLPQSSACESRST